MQESPLFKRVYGALIGSAIGDAMGGPVEMLPFEVCIWRPIELDTKESLRKSLNFIRSFIKK